METRKTSSNKVESYFFDHNGHRSIAVLSLSYDGTPINKLEIDNRYLRTKSKDGNARKEFDCNSIDMAKRIIDENCPLFQAESQTTKTRSHDGRFNIGDGAAAHFYSDVKAFTVIKISPNGKQITVQRDKATLKPGHKPDIIPGGFAGHCTNNRALEYDYETDPEGELMKFSYREKMDSWVQVGGTRTAGARLSQGRYEFYDYNF